MKSKKNFSSLGEASKFLGEDFWDVMSDILPFIGPRIDVVRTEKDMIIIAELPGIVSQEDLSITLQGHLIIIEGEIKRPYIQDHYELKQDERFSGPFKRKVRLSEDCIPEEMSASYVSGLLQIVIPTYNDEQSYPKQEVPVHFIHNDFMFKGDKENGKN